MYGVWTSHNIWVWTSLVFSVVLTHWSDVRKQGDCHEKLFLKIVYVQHNNTKIRGRTQTGPVLIVFEVCTYSTGTSLSRFCFLWFYFRQNKKKREPKTIENMSHQNYDEWKRQWSTKIHVWIDENGWNETMVWRKDRDERSKGTEILISEPLTKNKSSEPFRLENPATRRNRNWSDIFGSSLVRAGVPRWVCKKMKRTKSS
jgi:hypothetical protein